MPVATPVAAATPVPTSFAWAESYEAAVARATAEGKPLMLSFGASWCPACKYLDENSYSSPNVIAESGRFVQVRIDTDARNDLSERYNITKLPTVVWANSTGGEMGRTTGGGDNQTYITAMKYYGR